MICLNDIEWFDIRIYNSPEYRYIGREMVNGRFENACPKCGHTVSADWCYYCDVPIADTDTPPDQGNIRS